MQSIKVGNSLLSMIGSEMMGEITRVNLRFASGRNAWKHNLTTLRSIFSVVCGPANTQNNQRF